MCPKRLFQPELKKSINLARENLLEAENKKLGLKSMKMKGKKASNSSDDKEKEKAPMEDVSSDVQPNPLTSGNYSLFGCVTHKGREADSGHYVGWVRKPIKGAINDKNALFFMYFFAPSSQMGRKLRSKARQLTRTRGTSSMMML